LEQEFTLLAATAPLGALCINVTGITNSVVSLKGRIEIVHKKNLQVSR